MKFSAPHLVERFPRLNSLLRGLFSPPTFADSQKTLLAQTLHYLLILGFILSGAYAVLTLFIASEPSGMILSGGMALVSLLLFRWLHQKRFELVSRTLIVCAYLAIMATLVVNGGIRDEAALVLIALLSIAGFLLGAQVVLPLGLLTAVLFTVLYLAELLHLIPEEEHFFPVGQDELVLSLIAIFVTTIVLYQIARQMNRKTEEIQAQALYLAEKNRQLHKTQSELITAKETAEEANRSRSVFFSRMSHDLRTPLGSILGFTTHLLQDGKDLDSQTRQEFVQGIHRSGTHLLNLINDLLDISRLEAHQLTLQPHPTPLFVALSEIIMMLQVTAEDKGLLLRLEMDEDVPRVVLVDEQRLQQVIINLLANAVKFTAVGEIALTVTAARRAESVHAVTFAVTDTGCGIAPHDLKKIFEPFIQVTNRNAGTGLGLAICRQLVEAMDSSLHVESRVGQGSRFWFTLELPEAPVGESVLPDAGEKIGNE